MDNTMNPLYNSTSTTNDQSFDPDVAWDPYLSATYTFDPAATNAVWGNVGPINTIPASNYHNAVTGLQYAGELPQYVDPSTFQVPNVLPAYTFADLGLPELDFPPMGPVVQPYNPTTSLPIPTPTPPTTTNNHRPPRPAPAQGGSARMCPTCNKSFGNASALSKHNKTHAATKKYACWYCSARDRDVAFARPDHLKRHVRKEAGKDVACKGLKALEGVAWVNAGDKVKGQDYEIPADFKSGLAARHKGRHGQQGRGVRPNAHYPSPPDSGNPSPTDSGNGAGIGPGSGSEEMPIVVNDYHEFNEFIHYDI